MIENSFKELKNLIVYMKTYLGQYFIENTIIYMFTKF